MRGFEANEKMDVIGYPTDALWYATQAANSAAKIFVKTRTPFGCDERLSVFRGEDQMI